MNDNIKNNITNEIFNNKQRMNILIENITSYKKTVSEKTELKNFFINKLKDETKEGHKQYLKIKIADFDKTISIYTYSLKLKEDEYFKINGLNDFLETLLKNMNDVKPE